MFKADAITYPYPKFHVGLGNIFLANDDPALQ